MQKLLRLGLVWIFSSALVRGDIQDVTDLLDTASDDGSCATIAGNAEIVVASSHVINAMRRGWWGCAEILGRAAAASGVDGIEKDILQESRAYTNKLSALRSLLESAQPPSQIISPAFQWAQSGDSIFMNVKFSHKIDAPATLNSQIRAVNLTNNSLHLYAIKERKAFELSLGFFGAINPDESSWNAASVGRIVLTIQKADAPVAWPKLLSDASKKPQNMHFWWDKAEEFSDEIDDLRENGDKKPEVAKEKPKKKKAKSSGESSKGTVSSKKAKQKSKTAAAEQQPPQKISAMDKGLNDISTNIESKLKDAAEKDSTTEGGADSTETPSLEAKATETMTKVKLTPKEKSYQTIDEEMMRKIRLAEEKAQQRKREIQIESKRKKDEIDAETASSVADLKAEAAKKKADLREKYNIVEETDKASTAPPTAEDSDAHEVDNTGSTTSDEL